MSQLESQMRHRDKEMVPKFLVQAMFGLMFLSVALVAYAQWTDRPNVGVLNEAEIVAERSIFVTGTRDGVYTATDAVTGEVLARSNEDMNGFIAVLGRMLERHRQIAGVVGQQPLTVVRRVNGNTAVIDPTTGLVTELIGYGADNIAAFGKLVN